MSPAADLLEVAAGRVREARAVLAAIEAGELLAAVPATPRDRAAHAAAVSLLAILERELAALAELLEPV